MNNNENLIGLKNNKLTIIDIGNGLLYDGYKHKSVVCQCDCGTVKEIRLYDFKSGRVKSCGCFNYNSTHGMTETSEYYTWKGIKARCTNPNNERYADYGARGIKIHESWINDFQAFYDYMGPKPGPEYTIDRIDNDGHYEPGNVRWATKEEQASNKRNTYYITYNDVTKSIGEWSRLYDIPANTLRARIEHGWDLDAAFNAPIPYEYKKNITEQSDIIQIPEDDKIIQIVGSVLDQTDVHAIINTVNCVGVMGKGIALEFKKEYPENFRIYQRLCLNKQVHVGKMLPYHIERPYGPKYVINFPTKLHWHNDSKIEYIAEGLEDLKRLCQELFVTKIAMPRLGCGNGGLHWPDVLQLIKQVFSDTNIEVKICYQFRLIIAGSRDIDDYELVKNAYRQSGFEATEIVSGHARGIDKCGERLSEELLGHKAKLFPADWNHLGNSAGYVRNEQMASYADGLLAIWDGQSRGTKSMIDIAYKRKLKVYVVSVLQEGSYVN